MLIAEVLADLFGDVHLEHTLVGEFAEAARRCFAPALVVEIVEHFLVGRFRVQGPLRVRFKSAC